MSRSPAQSVCLKSFKSMSRSIITVQSFTLAAIAGAENRTTMLLLLHHLSETAVHGTTQAKYDYTTHFHCSSLKKYQINFEIC